MSEIFKINGASFECEFLLKDDKGKVQIEFSKDAIKGLDLSESIFEPFTHAEVFINNPFDYIDNTFQLRGDGRDLFEFTLKHKGAPDSEKLNYKFVINGENNSISKRDRANNFKSYTLLDVNYFKLNEEIPYGTRYRGKVGDIIKDILSDILGDDIIKEDSFAPGDHDINLFPEHILPASSFKYSDLIKYLLGIYYSIEGELAIKSFLIFDRKDSKYSLVPISKIFEENKDRLLEGFGVGDLISKSDSSNKSNPPPDAKVNEYLTPLSNTDFTTPMLTYSNEFFMNVLATGYDQILGEHAIREIRIKEVKKKWKKKFVDVFTCQGGKPTAFLPLNKVKKEEQFRTISLPFSIDTVAKICEADLVANLTFYNLQLNINNLGDTNRRSGQFIDIYKPAKEETVDKKLLGRWLVTVCRHQFVGNSYQNTMQCIKTYVGPGAKISDDIE